MPNLPFTSSGVAETLRNQDRIRQGAEAIQQEYKEANADARRTAQEANRAIKTTLTDIERVQQKIEAVRKAQQRGVGDQEKNRQALERLNAQLVKLKKNSGGVGDNLEKAFGGAALSAATRFVAPITSIATAAGVITNEIRSQLRLIDEAASAKLTVSQARNEVLRNLPGVDEATRRAVLKEGQDLAASVGVDEAFIQKARANALSASGGNRQASLEAVTGASRFLFDQPDAIGGFAGSLLDLSKATGTSDANTNLGLLTKIAGLSRITNPRAQAANIPAALIGARGFGFSTAEAGGLLATLTEFAGDLTGESGRTATIQVARALRDFREENLKKPQSNLLDDAGLERLKAIENLPTGEKLRALQQDALLSKVFLKGFAGEQRFRAQVEQLVSDADSVVAQRFVANAAQIGGNDALAAEGRAALRGLGVNELNRQVRFESGLGAVDQQLAVRDPNENLSSEARQRLQNILQRTGSSNLGARSRALISRFSDDSIGLSVDEAAGLIETVAADLEDGERAREIALPGVAGFGGRTFTSPGRAATPEELETAKLLRELLALTAEGVKEQKKQTEKIESPTIPTR